MPESLFCVTPQAEPQPGPCRDWDPAGTLLRLASLVVWTANLEDGSVHLWSILTGAFKENKRFLSSRWSSDGGCAAPGQGSALVSARGPTHGPFVAIAELSWVRSL